MKANVKKGVLAKVDTLFTKPLFNGLIYTETLQTLTYNKHGLVRPIVRINSRWPG